MESSNQPPSRPKQVKKRGSPSNESHLKAQASPQKENPIRGPKNTQKKKKSPKKSKKYLQIKELMTTYKPVTINGLPISSICQQVEERDEKKAVDKYLLKKLTNEPNEPIYISFIVIPSDPDFPFDLDVLKISLCIPPLYGVKRVIPSIYVLNDEIPRGFAANIESGFKSIADLAVRGVQLPDKQVDLVGGTGLTGQIMTLDKYLEYFLRLEKRKTIKFVMNKPTSTQSSRESSPVAKPKMQKPKAKSASPFKNDTKDLPINEHKRNLLIEQFSQKFQSDIKLFNKSKVHTKFKVWIPINNTFNVPETWKHNRKLEIILSVPITYPQGELTISIPPKFLERMGLHGELETNLIKNFTTIDLKDESIISYVNYLSNNIGILCLDTKKFQEYQKLVTAFKTII